MANSIRGLHHVTAISGAPQDNLDFMIGTLRQRFVKRTVNFDAPDTYHFYYGDRLGSPGTIMTYFPFVDAGPGRAGSGMASSVAYAVPRGGLDAWIDHFAFEALDFEGPHERFGERVVAIRAPDGLCIELIETEHAVASDGDGCTDDGFHSVTLESAKPDRTAQLLVDVFGYSDAGEKSDGEAKRHQFISASGDRGSVVDLLTPSKPTLGRMGAGTIHHVAFRAEDDADQLEWRERLGRAGYDVTSVVDRQYFNAIYFREPGGVLFEIATDPPGFSTDEPVEALGKSLKLPPKYEASRERIERALPEIRVPA